MAFQGSGALSGAGTGIATGAAVGSIFGPAGTVVGGLVGGGIGAIAGGIAGGKEKTAQNNILNLQKITAQQQQTKAMQAEAELDALNRPKISAEVDRLGEVASLAERYAREGMPEAQRQAAADDIQRSQAMQLGAASGLGAGLRGLGGTQASTAQSYRNLAAQDAMMAQQNQAQYLGALGNLAGAEARQEQFNEVDPYYEDFNRLYMEKQAMEGAALQNRFGAANYGLALQQQRNQATQQGIQDLSGSLTTLAGMPSTGNFFSGLGGGGGSNATGFGGGGSSNYGGGLNYSQGMSGVGLGSAFNQSFSSGI